MDDIKELQWMQWTHIFCGDKQGGTGLKLEYPWVLQHWCPEEPDDCWVCSVLSGVLSNRVKGHDVMLLRTTELSAPEKQKVLCWDRNASTPKGEHLDLPSSKVN